MLYAIILAAGFGTRLARDIRKDETRAFQRLENVPKPLFPVGGATIVDHWLESLYSAGLQESVCTVLVTNAKYQEQFQHWLQQGKYDQVYLVTNTATSEENQQGAIKDLWLAVEYIHKHLLNASDNHSPSYIVIAGDTLVPFLKLEHFVTRFLCSRQTLDSLVLAYEPKDKEDLTRRGVFQVEHTQDGIRALSVIEKPTQPDEAPSSIASIPVYLFSFTLKQDLEDYLFGGIQRNVDALGHFLSWLCSFRIVYLYMTPYRLDIGSLEQYKEALWFVSCLFQGEAGGRHVQRVASETETCWFKDCIKGRKENENAVGRALPRVGLIGNPSDGYGGKVISCTIQGCGFAQVIAEPSDTFCIVPHAIHDALEFSSLQEMHETTSACGFYGGLRLLQAACVTFYRLCEQHQQHFTYNCKLHYSSTIPRQVGFGGSSALLIACFRCLSTFYQIPMLQLASLEQWPTIVLECETQLLNISAGLQDRVAQVMEGVIYMDFSELNQGMGKYKRLNRISLPEMYLAWLPRGKFSGTVHSNLGVRWRNKEPLVLETMQLLGQLADKLLENWGRLDASSWALLVDENFEYRRRLLGDQGIGQGNWKMIEIARQEGGGMGAKLVGSGGAILCVPRGNPDPLWLCKLQRAFHSNDIHFCKLQVAW